MTLAEVRARREEILAIARRHGACDVRMFGSVARGEAEPRSDVDFLVALEPGRSLLGLGGLPMDLREHLGCGVDVVTEAGLRPRLRERVVREPAPLRGTTASGTSTSRTRPTAPSASAPPMPLPGLIIHAPRAAAFGRSGWRPARARTPTTPSRLPPTLAHHG